MSDATIQHAISDLSTLTNAEQIWIAQHLIRGWPWLDLPETDGRNLRIQTIPTSRLIEPGATAAITVRINRTCEPLRLIISETQYTEWQVVRDPSEEIIDIPSTGPFDRLVRYLLKQPTTRTVRHDGKTEAYHRTLFPAGWEVCSIYVGDEPQLQGPGAVNGSAFALDAKPLSIQWSTAWMGYDISLAVIHHAPVPVAFSGFFVVEILGEEKRAKDV